jgi:hypothetical protein
MARRSATKAAQSETDESVDSQVEEVDQPSVEEEAPEESEAPEVEDDESDEELDSVVEEDESDESDEDFENEDDESEEDEDESDEEPTQAPKAKAPKAEPADLGPFQEAATAAVEEADKTTGDLSEEVIDSVNKVYREIEGVKGKNQARAWLDEEMKAAIMGKDIFRARSIVNLKDGLSAGSGSSGPKAPADPTTAFVQKVVALRLATDEVIGNVPEGVSEEWTGKADELLASLADDIASYRAYVASTDEDAEAPEVSPVVRQAFKLASGRGSSGGSGRVAGGPRRDIEKHLIQVFEGLEDGAFLTVNEIAKAPPPSTATTGPAPVPSRRGCSRRVVTATTPTASWLSTRRVRCAAPQPAGPTSPTAPMTSARTSRSSTSSLPR